MVEIMSIRKILMLITSVRIKIQLKGNSMGPIKIHNGGNYAHGHDSDAYNFC